MKVFKENAGKEVNEVNKDVNRLMSNKSNNANLFNELQKIDNGKSGFICCYTVSLTNLCKNKNIIKL